MGFVAENVCANLFFFAFLVTFLLEKYLTEKSFSFSTVTYFNFHAKTLMAHDTKIGRCTDILRMFSSALHGRLPDIQVMLTMPFTPPSVYPSRTSLFRKPTVSECGRLSKSIMLLLVIPNWLFSLVTLLKVTMATLWAYFWFVCGTQAKGERLGEIEHLQSRSTPTRFEQTPFDQTRKNE